MEADTQSATHMTSAETPSQQPLSRREFLYYFGGASITLLGATTCGLLARFVSPPVEKDMSKILIPVDLSALPQPGDNPIYDSQNRFYLINTPSGLLALDAACPKSGSLLKWVALNDRFECPQCGSKFSRDGTWVEGIAKRTMDRYVLQATTAAGVRATSWSGDPLPVNEASSLVVNLGLEIRGKPAVR